MRCRLGLLAAVAAVLAVAAAAPARAGVFIKIDKTAQQMTVSVDGADLYVWPVSTGRRGYDTPNGAYTARWMEEMHYSKQWDYAPMPHSIFFTDEGHAVHGTYEQRNLGRAASHGCVRLSLKNATTLYRLVEKEGKKNTTVLLTGELPKNTPPAMVARHNRRPTRTASDDGYGGDARGYARDRYGYRESGYYRTPAASRSSSRARCSRCARGAVIQAAFVTCHGRAKGAKRRLRA